MQQQLAESGRLQELDVASSSFELLFEPFFVKTVVHTGSYGGISFIDYAQLLVPDYTMIIHKRESPNGNSRFPLQFDHQRVINQILLSDRSDTKESIPCEETILEMHADSGTRHISFPHEASAIYICAREE